MHLYWFSIAVQQSVCVSQLMSDISS